MSLDSRLYQALVGESLQSDFLENDTHSPVSNRTDVQSVPHSNWCQFLKRGFNSVDHDENHSNPDNTESGQTGTEEPPFLNIVMHAVGPLDEIEPFVALGFALSNYGHRVRIATHLAFEDLVKENGLEFFDIEGGPAHRNASEEESHCQTRCLSDLQKENFNLTIAEVSNILDGCWRSCFENSDQFISVDDASASTYFLAQAIVANPASLGHTHCAEKLGIPLHLMSTSPCSPTKSFPHPIVNIHPSSFNDAITNYLSYIIVEYSAWKRLGNEINRFRRLTLALPPLSVQLMPNYTQSRCIPHIYCWSSGLLPKPEDWNPSIVISGFMFLSPKVLSSPPPDLEQFITNGTPPIYIDLRSAVIDSLQPHISLLINATHLTGLRAIILVGMEEYETFHDDIPSNTYFLTSSPDQKLLRQACCVIHCGSIGLTRAVLAAGKPSVIVPFLRDQSFWGTVIEKSGVGSEPVFLQDITAQKLAAAINTAIKPQNVLKATSLGERMQAEDGVSVAMTSLHDQLLKSSLTCSIDPTKAAAWKVSKTKIRLSSCAAAVLMGMGLLDFEKIDLLRPCSYFSSLETGRPSVQLKFSMVDPPSNNADDLKAFTFLIEDSSNRKRKNGKIDLALLSDVHNSSGAGELHNTRANPAVLANLREFRERYRVRIPDWNDIMQDPWGIDLVQEPGLDIYDCHMTQITPLIFNARRRGLLNFIMRSGADALPSLSLYFSGFNELFRSSFKTLISYKRNHAPNEAFSAYEKTLLKQGVAEAARLGEADYTHIMRQWKVATAHVKQKLLKNCK